MGWTLDRTVGALQRLEAGLANTGLILTRLGHQSYTLVGVAIDYSLPLITRWREEREAGRSNEDAM